jgi:type IV pilus assembly protein PilC
MLYHYLASSKNGKIMEGEYEAENLAKVLQYLAGHELQPVTVTPVKAVQSSVKFFLGKITLVDKIFISRYLSLMLKVGTDLLSAVNILISDFEKPAVKNFLIEVRNNLSKGQPFYQAFAKYPKVFSMVFVNLVKAAEASGRLQQTFEELSLSLQKESDLRRKIKGALIYPVILLIASFAIFMFLSLFALPKIAKVFGDTGVNPPAFSRVVFAVGLFFGDHALAIVLSLIVVGISSFVFFGKTLVGRQMMSRVLSRTPVIRNVYRDLAIQRFASTFSSLLAAGLPIIETTKITADVVGSEEFKVSLIRIADEGLAKGLTIGEAFRREVIYPKVVTNLIAISEKAGHLEEVLDTVSEFYTSNVDNSVRTMVSFLEPVLLMFMGGMVAVIALSIIVPIYQLTNQF